jgi:copper(I)-binding protein
VSSTSRRRVIAVAALLAAAPTLAACGTGFDANTNQPYAPTEAGVLISETGSPAGYGKNGVMISQAFILGPDSGGQIPTGGSAPLYLHILNTTTTADALSGITPDEQFAASVRTAGPIQLAPNTPATTQQITVEGLKRSLRGGESVRLTLNFQKAGSVTLAVPVMTRSREFASLPPVPGAQPAPSPAATTEHEAEPAASH